MIELKALNPHWLDSFEEPEYDLCVHSPVWLKIDDKIVSNEESGDWTVSASAYEFLRSLKENHNSDEDEQLLPCCGFNFWKTGNKIFFGNCGTGMNWDISLGEDHISHRFEDGDQIKVNFNEWRDAVVRFADEVLEFYRTSEPRKFSDDESKKNFEFFLSELKSLRSEAVE